MPMPTEMPKARATAPKVGATVREASITWVTTRVATVDST